MNSGKHIPPKIALKFLRWFCREDYVEEIEGDLIEVFENQYAESLRKAKVKFYWSVLRYFRPEFIKAFQTNQHPNSLAMFRHNFLLTVRYFKKSKTSFFINFLSLFIGLSCSILIYLWAQDELKTDRFHDRGDRLIQVLQNDKTPNGIETEAYTPGILAESLKEEFPIVEKATSVVPYEWFEGEQLLLSNGKGKIFSTQNQFATEDYFNIFSFEIIAGDRDQALASPNSVVITDLTAQKLFGSTDVIGYSLEWIHEDYGGTYQVTGVVKNPPAHSTIQFDAVFPYSVFIDENDDLTDWSNSDPYTYVALKNSASLYNLNASLDGFLQKKSGYKGWSLIGQVFSDRYLYGSYENGIPKEGRIKYVKLFALMSALILLIAIINFVNMATAEATGRMREIGVKKAIGIYRTSLVNQFLTESLFISFSAFIFAVFFLLLILPQFNLIVGKQMAFSFDLGLISALLVITFLTGIVAGIYPALYLSGFSPVKALKGYASKGKKAQQARRALVVFQFSISAILIFSVIVIYNQIEYIQSKNLGFDKDNIIWFTSGIPSNSAEETSLTGEDIELLLSRFREISGVEGAANFAQNIAGEYGTTTDLSWDGKNPDEDLLFANFSVGYDFISTLDIEIKEGRSFSRDFQTDHEKIIFNQAAINAMSLKDPLGQVVELWGDKREIIGVVEDFHIASFYEEILPTFIKLDVNSFASNIMVKLEAGNEAQVVSQIESVYKDFFIDGMPFEFTFLDENYQQLYENELKTSALSKYSAIVAIVISCLGLFGFANFMVRKRLKEVGIRKMLGASRMRIIKLMTIEFNVIVLISLLIALPLSYLILNDWLNQFAFKIDITWWQILGGSLLVMLSAWLTITAQTIKAVNVNPVECIKDE